MQHPDDDTLPGTAPQARAAGPLAARRAELAAVLRRQAVCRGRFRLASGQWSDVYVDCRQVTLDPAGLELASGLVHDVWRSRVPHARAVGGPATGAVPLAVGVSLVAHRRGERLPAFYVRLDPKTHGTGRRIEGPPGVTSGPVLLVEDVTTTGASTVRCVAACRACGFEPLLVVALVDREQGARAALEAVGVPLHALLTVSELLQAPAVEP